MILLSDLKEVAFYLEWTIISATRAGVIVNSDKKDTDDDSWAKWYHALIDFFNAHESLKELKEHIHYYESAIKKLNQYINGEKYYELYDSEEIPSIYDELDYYFTEADTPLPIISDNLKVFLIKTHRLMIAMGAGFEEFFPDVKVHVKTKEGDLVQENPDMEFDRKMGANLKAIEMESNVEGYLNRMKKVKSMIAEKAEPLEILKLLK